MVSGPEARSCACTKDPWPDGVVAIALLGTRRHGTYWENRAWPVVNSFLGRLDEWDGTRIVDNVVDGGALRKRDQISVLRRWSNALESVTGAHVRYQGASLDRLSVPFCSQQRQCYL